MKSMTRSKKECRHGTVKGTESLQTRTKALKSLTRVVTVVTRDPVYSASKQTNTQVNITLITKIYIRCAAPYYIRTLCRINTYAYYVFIN